MERTGEALNLLEEALQAQVFDVVTYSILSRVYAHVGDEESARRVIDAGLVLEPEHRNLLLGLDCLNEKKTLPLVANARRRVVEYVSFGEQDDTFLGSGGMENFETCVSIYGVMSLRLRNLRKS